VVKKYQREKGRAAVEERNDQYMRSKTIGGQTMLDPTGVLWMMHCMVGNGTIDKYMHTLQPATLLKISLACS
jgi:hypothetical protein